MSHQSTSLSVCITYYNEGSLLTACIQSLVEYGLYPDEIIVYDDASPIPAKDYVKDYPSVRVIRSEENKGAGYARNHLMQVAIGKYIHIHDADDLFHSDWLSAIVDTIQSQQPDLIVTNYRSFKDGDKPDTLQNGGGNLKITELTHLPRFMIVNAIPPWLTTFQREIGLKIGGYNPNFPPVADIDFHTRLSLHTERALLLDRPLVFQRVRAESLSRVTNRDKQKKDHRTQHDMLASLAEVIPEAYHQDLSELATGFAMLSARNRLYPEARALIQLASELGELTYAQHPKLYQLFYKRIGLISFERLMSLYRSLLPHRLRSTVSNVLSRA